MAEYPDQTTRERGKWVVMEGETPDDPWIFWLFDSDNAASSNDQQLIVYLPKGENVRRRAAEIIADALNREGVPGPSREEMKR